MPRKKLIAANWKMHQTIRQTEAFAAGLKSSLDTLPSCDLSIFPPFFSVPAAAAVLAGTPVAVGAQDVFWEETGAYTGEVSGGMIADAGGTQVIVGHSERRHVIGESDEAVARKLRATLDAGLTAILCVGEQISHRDAGEAEPFVEGQLDSALSVVDAAELPRVVIAYEPVWAIGTGKTATPSDAEAMHRFVRGLVGSRHGEEHTRTLRILYGGSVKPGNARSLLALDEIDGALVGGASLELESFLAIAGASA